MKKRESFASSRPAGSGHGLPGGFFLGFEIGIGRVDAVAVGIGLEEPVHALDGIVTLARGLTTSLFVVLLLGLAVVSGVLLLFALVVFGVEQLALLREARCL